MLLSLVALLCACGADEVEPREQITFVAEDMHTPDASPDLDMPRVIEEPDAGPADQGEPPADMAAPEADMEKEVKFFEFLQSEWEKETPCRGDVTPTPIERAFEYPERSTAYDIGKTSREELEAFAKTVNYTFIHQVTFDESLRPDRRSIVLYRNDEEDVHMYIHTVVQSEDIERTNGMITVLVDYKPVQATFKFSQNRWDNEVFSRQDSGVRFPIDTQFSMMEVILPAALFTEERMYEIAIGQITNRYDGTDGGVFRKIHLFNKSYQQPEHPCFEEPLKGYFNNFEYGLVNEAVSAAVLLFPTYYPSLSEIAFERIIPAEPGQKVQINMSARARFAAEERERLVFLKPLLDGKPLEQEWRVSFAPKNEGDFDIEARKTFEVTLPEEPGIYEVSMAVWHDPHLMAVDLDGNNRAGYSTGGGGDTSNLLRFEVKATEGNSTESGD